MFTVVIIGFNSSFFFREQIELLFSLASGDFTVVYIDNGSAVKHKNRTKKLLADMPVFQRDAIVYVERTQSRPGSWGHGEGLNFAINLVSTPYVVVLDADAVILKQDWVSYFYELLNRADGDVLIGAVPVANSNKTTSVPTVYLTVLASAVAREIDFRPLNIQLGEDTGFRLRTEVHRFVEVKRLIPVSGRMSQLKSIGFSGTGVVFFDGDLVIGAHFSRGSSLGYAKYKHWWKSIPLIRVPLVRSYFYFELWNWNRFVRAFKKNRGA